MTSFAESEKRLNAALARIDRVLDRPVPAAAAGEDDTARLQAEIAALKARVAELESR